jgi:hypothetical protein
MEPDIQSYLLSWSNEIGARKNRVRELIGDAHWLSDGHHKESILREFFLRYLPRDLNIGRGFVKTTRDLTLCSPEVDILVSDPRLNPPFLFDGDLQIVDSSSVIAQIEVKTTFCKSTLKDALLNVCRTQLIIGNYRDTDQVWKGIYFFSGDTKQTLEDLINMTEAALKEVASSLANNEPPVQMIVPTCIAVLDRHCCFLNQTSPNNVSIKLFDLKQLSFPCAFADMFSAMRRRNGGAVLGGLDNVIESLNVAKPLTREVSL